MSLNNGFNLPSLSTATPTEISYFKKYLRLGMVCAIATLMLPLTGCNTTHEFKPTASVMVGKSL